MSYLHLPFMEAVEFLGERFHVPLDRVEQEDKPGWIEVYCVVL